MLYPDDNQPCAAGGDLDCYQECLVLIKLHPETPKETKPLGIWFVYGTDYNAYPVSVFNDELEARRSMESYEQIVFWPFGVKWHDVKSV